MLHKFTRPFKLGGEDVKLRRKHLTNTSSMAVGLGILVHVSSHTHGDVNDSKTLLKSASFRLSPTLSTPQEQYCYLKSCFLCNKKLNPDQDIYMYRGDQGFCSLECRNRQIITDDKKELALSTKKSVAAYRRCAGMSETGVLLDDLRRRNKHIPTQKARAIFL